MKTIQIERKRFYPPKNEPDHKIRLQISTLHLASAQDSSRPYADNGSYNALKSVESCLHIPMISGSQADHD